MNALLFVAALLSVDSAVTGTWAGDDGTGTPISFTIEASGKCGFYDEEDGTCTAKGGKITYRGEDFTETYTYSVSGSRLTMSGGDLENKIVLTRKGGAPAKGSASVPAPPEPVKITRPTVIEPEEGAAATAPVKATGSGATVTKAEWGVAFTPPAGWKPVREQGDVIVFGHDVEAGMIIVTWQAGSSEAQIRTEFAKGMDLEGLSMRPTGGLKAYSNGSMKNALAGELSGDSADGAAVRARAIGAASPHGGAFAIVALTTAEKYPTLKARAEQLAGTVKFSKPKAPPVNKGIAGNYWYFSANSGGSSEGKIALCSDGRYFRGGEMSGSNAGGSAYAANTSGGRWSATGGASGTLTLTEASGETSTTSYAISQNPKDTGGHGPALIIGSRTYQKTGNGNCN